MSGLVKAKKYDWKDSNMALFGSDTERQVKKESAQTEPAWEGAGQEVGLKIWRIVNFKVEDWPVEDYGQFFSGDSYIILNTYKPNPDSEELAYDVHFWIGSHSTQDEYGTVAYKTVELDTFLDDKAIQHREVQGRESEMFKSYFKSMIFRIQGLYEDMHDEEDEYGSVAYKTVELDTFLDEAAVQHREVMGHESEQFLSYFDSVMIMAGGAETGFRHVEDEQYTPRLMHFSGDRRVVLKEVPCVRSRLTSGDVFILDLGKTLYQWNGSGSSKNERYEAAMFLSKLKNDRAVDESEVLEEEGLSDEHPFYQALTGEDEEDDDEPDEGGLKELYRVSDASGTLNIEKIKEGDVSMGDFQSADVFILDIGNECFVWIGGGSSDKEKRNGISYAHKHLMGTNHALVPIVVIKEGQRNSDFSTAIAA